MINIDDYQKARTILEESEDLDHDRARRLQADREAYENRFGKPMSEGCSIKWQLEHNPWFRNAEGLIPDFDINDRIFEEDYSGRIKK